MSEVDEVKKAMKLATVEAAIRITEQYPHSPFKEDQEIAIARIIWDCFQAELLKRAGQ